MKFKNGDKVNYEGQIRLIVGVHKTILGTAYDTRNEKDEIEVLFERNLRRLSNDTNRGN